MDLEKMPRDEMRSVMKALKQENEGLRETMAKEREAHRQEIDLLQNALKTSGEEIIALRTKCDAMEKQFEHGLRSINVGFGKMVLYDWQRRVYLSDGSYWGWLMPLSDSVGTDLSISLDNERYIAVKRYKAGEADFFQDYSSCLWVADKDGCLIPAQTH